VYEAVLNYWPVTEHSTTSTNTKDLVEFVLTIKDYRVITGHILLSVSNPTCAISYVITSRWWQHTDSSSIDGSTFVMTLKFSLDVKCWDTQSNNPLGYYSSLPNSWINQRPIRCRILCIYMSAIHSHLCQTLQHFARWHTSAEDDITFGAFVTFRHTSAVFMLLHTYLRVVVKSLETLSFSAKSLRYK